MIAAIARPPIDWPDLSPELVLLGTSAICLLVAVLVPRALRQASAFVVSLGGFAGAFVAAAVLYSHTHEGAGVIADAIRRDRFGALAAVIVAGAGFLSTLVLWSEPRRGLARNHVAEEFALLLAAAGGMVFLAQANNLLTLFLGLEWFSISLYILCAVNVEKVGSLEAGLKYLIVGSFGSAVLLFGSALVYGATGELGFPQIAQAVATQGLTHDVLLLFGLAMIIAGLGFKSSAAPFHMWTPDVYEGAPTSVTAFMAAATKVAALVLTLRVMFTAFPEEQRLWTVALAVIVCISLAIGNLAALVQRSVKRILAYSSVSHAGFMLIAVASNNALGGRALLYYLIPYAAMSVGSFAVVAARERELRAEVTLDNLAGMGWERPFFGIAMWTFMLGFAGLPPTGGFVGKFYVFSAAYDRGWIWLVIVGLVATAVSLYYYLGIIRSLYMRPAAAVLAVAGGQPPREWALQLGVSGALAVTVGSFFGVQPLIDLARHAFVQLPL